MGEIIDDEPYEDPNQYWPMVDDSPDPLGDLRAAATSGFQALKQFTLVITNAQRAALQSFQDELLKSYLKSDFVLWPPDPPDPKDRPKPVKSHGPRNGPAFTRRGRKNY